MEWVEAGRKWLASAGPAAQAALMGVERGAGGGVGGGVGGGGWGSAADLPAPSLPSVEQQRPLNPADILTTAQGRTGPFSREVILLSRVQLFVTPWITQSMEFSRPEYWSG